MKYPNTQGPKHPNTQVRKHPNTQGPKYPSTQGPKYPNTQVPKYPSTQTPKYANTQTPKYANTQVLKHASTQVPKYPSSYGSEGVGMVCDRSTGNSESDRPYDLGERTMLFAESVIDFLKEVPAGPRTNRLIDQLTGAGTSVGANYCEADDAPSKKSYRNLISTCKREAREAEFFIRIIARAVPDLGDEARALWQEAKELHLIFCKLYRGSGQE